MSEHTFSGSWRQALAKERVNTYSGKTTADPGDWVFTFDDDLGAFVVGPEQAEELGAEAEPEPQAETATTATTASTAKATKATATEAGPRTSAKSSK